MIAAEPDVWRRLAEGLAQGRSGWLVTVLSTWGAAPRLPGSVWVLWDDGTMMGSVSGGCIEEDLQSRLRTSRSPGYRLFGLTYGDREGDRERFRLPCGGTLHLVAERLVPVPDLMSHFRQVADALLNRRAICRGLSLSGSLPDLTAPRREAVESEPERICLTYGPVVRLLLMGAGPVAEALTVMALQSGMDVAVCEPREAWRSSWSVAGVRPDAALPDDWLQQKKPDHQSAIVCLSHDPRVDDMALLEALKGPALLVGAMASARTARKRAERLQSLGLSPFELARLESPVGMDIGSRTPAEIAVSILARIFQVKNQRLPVRTDYPVPEALPDRLA
ncbi:XdhC family protein [Hahella sp. SMD15-11]|uniref:XdhC family protein n=1 Tax=Thermohahella caldifontis TaxID=3142973 RepID=A0AB39UXW6_9GAMM